LTDFKLGTSVSVKTEDDFLDVWRTQVAMHRNCHIFTALHANVV